jgi:TolA-binding protein
MKNAVRLFILLLILAAMFRTSYAQTAAAPQASSVGEVSYLEGSVKIVTGTAAVAAKLGDQLSIEQTIQTGSDGLVEIKWTNGTKTTITASSKQPVRPLYEGSTKDVKSSTGGLWSSFLSLFKQESTAGKQETGGIRRNMAEVRSKPGKNDLYWKSDEEMTFEKASALYEAKQYAKAANALRAFLEQKPQDPKAKVARFALGHCYVELNNTASAKGTFQTFITQYPNDSLTKSAQSVLEKY